MGCEKRSFADRRTVARAPHVDPSAENNYAIGMAAENGHVQIVDRLLEHPRVDPADDDNFAIRRAAENGHLQVVERLLEHPRVDPSAKDNQAIRFAACDGHLQVVERLLEDPRVDPSACDNQAIRWAAKRGHAEIVQRLLDHPRMNWTTVDWSHLSGLPNASEIKGAFVLRRQVYARKRRALRTIVRYLYKRFGTAENLRHHIWKPGGYLSRTLATRYGNVEPVLSIV
jgi:hypothetical protein